MKLECESGTATATAEVWMEKLTGVRKSGKKYVPEGRHCRKKRVAKKKKGDVDEILRQAATGRLGEAVHRAHAT